MLRNTKYISGLTLLLTGIALLFFATDHLHAQVAGKNQVYIWGQVTNIFNGAPLDNQQVYIISDTLYNPAFQYNDHVATDEFGFFYDTIYTEKEKGAFKVFTFDYQNKYYDTTVYFRFEWHEVNNLLISLRIADSVPSVNFQANFHHFKDTTGLSPMRIHFLDGTGTGNIQSWEWNFGDGTFSEEQNPVHDYNEPGIYKVSLNIKGIVAPSGHEMVSSITKIIRVYPKSYFHLGGQIFGGYFPVDLGIVYLYQISTNSDIYMIDSMIFDTLGCYYFYQVLEGDYLIKADLHPESGVLNKYMGTYYGDVLFWKDADTICHTSSCFDFDIHLLPCVPLTSGPGSITGTITYEEDALRGIPAHNVQILLLNKDNLPFTGCHSDSNGIFKFEHLDLESYNVHAEVTGKTTYPVTVDLSEEYPSVEDLEIVINSHIVNGSVTYGIEETPGMSRVLEVFPNPVSAELNISFSAQIVRVSGISVFNAGLKKVFERGEIYPVAGHPVKLDVKQLPAGIYFVSVAFDNTTSELIKIIVTD